MKIKFTNYKPSEPGWYIAYYPLSQMYDMVHIIEGRDGLVNTSGSTHFTRWHCAWSEKIEPNIDALI